MSRKVKEWLIRGHCNLPNGKTIYFYGKTSAVSSTQAHFNLCWDIKRCFNIEEMVSPIIKECTVFTSSDFLARRFSPNILKYYEDKEGKIEIAVERKPSACASSVYGEEGEEIVDLSELGL